MKPKIEMESTKILDPEKQRQERWLKIFILFFTVVLLIILIMLPAVSMRQSQFSTSILIIFSLLSINIFSYYLVKRGYIQFAAWILSIVSLGGVTYTIFIFDGIRSSIVFGYFVVVGVVSLFLHGRATFVFLLLNIGALIVTYSAEQSGFLIASPSEKSSIDDLIILILALFLNTVLLQLLLGDMADSAEEARAAAYAAAESNEELNKSQAMLREARDLLEERVMRRTAQLSQANLELTNEVKSRRLAQKTLRDGQQRLRRQNKALLKLAQNQAFGLGNLQNALREITEVTALTLTVERVSVWLYNRETNDFHNTNLFIHSLNEHQKRSEASKFLPFQQIFTNNELINFSEGQISPFSINEEEINQKKGALMGAPIRVNGQPVGVVCCEHVGKPRRWSLEDEHFLNSVANLMALAMETSERRRAEEALRHSQKLESLGVLAGGVAHDFNNLLVAMLGQTSLTLAKLPSEHTAVPHITKAINAAKRAADLTRQLLAYSGRGQFEVQTFNLNDLIEENLHLFQVAVPKYIRLESDLVQMVPLIEADPGQLQQVVMNLILNASDAIGMNKGSIVVRTRPKWISAIEAETWEGVGTPLQAGHYISLVVEDSGCGMSPETISRIFDPFFTTKPTGRGLGLAAVMGIIRGHNGGVRVDSEIGKGTQFELIFPAGTAVTKHVEMMRLEPMESRHDLVMVIDDEAPVREAVKDILESNGLRVVTAVDGETGIDLYKQMQDQVNLVLLDLSLPGINGTEVYNQLHDYDPDLKVIISSGYSKDDVKMPTVDKELLGFLQKPYTMQGLLEKVWEYLIVA